jgi:hypothetical protein
MVRSRRRGLRWRRRRRMIDLGMVHSRHVRVHTVCKSRIGKGSRAGERAPKAGLHFNIPVLMSMIGSGWGRVEHSASRRWRVWRAAEISQLRLSDADKADCWDRKRNSHNQVVPEWRKATDTTMQRDSLATICLRRPLIVAMTLGHGRTKLMRNGHRNCWHSKAGNKDSHENATDHVRYNSVAPSLRPITH